MSPMRCRTGRLVVVAPDWSNAEGAETSRFEQCPSVHGEGVAADEHAAGTSEIIDLPEGVEYTWQSVERDHHGDLWIIGTDGALHMVDGESGEILATGSLESAPNEMAFAG